jgi:hypothetical protein
MKKISLQKRRPLRHPTVGLLIAINVVLVLALFHVSAAEIAAFKVLLRELRRWDS